MSAGDLTRAVLPRDGRVLIEQPTAAIAPPGPGPTGVRAQSDQEDEPGAASDPDAPPLDEAFWHDGRVIVPGQVRKRQTWGASPISKIGPSTAGRESPRPRASAF